MMALSRYTVTLSMGSVTAMSALQAAGAMTEAMVEAMASTVVRRMWAPCFAQRRGNHSLVIRIAWVLSGFDGARRSFLGGVFRRGRKA